MSKKVKSQENPVGQNENPSVSGEVFMVGGRGFEPLTFTMSM
jgi:hypothetical protein